MRKVGFLILLLALGLAACRPGLQVGPQLTSTPSPAPVQPTVFVPPTATATAAPTATPTQMPAPTPTSVPTLAPTAAPTAVLLRVQVDSPELGYLNVRNSPSTSGELVVKAADGALLDVLDAADTAKARVGQEGQWLKIRTAQGQEGFVAAWYLRLPGARPAPSPTRAAAGPALPTPAPNPSLDVVVELLNRTNALRAENGLPPLTLSAKLNAAAERHSQDMSNTGSIDHTGSDGSKPSRRITDTGYQALATGENIYGGRVTVDEAWAYWRDDPPHRANLLNAKFTEMGVSVVRGSRGWYYFTMTLAQPK